MTIGSWVSGLIVSGVGVMCIEGLANIVLSYLDHRKQESELIRNRDRLNINDFNIGIHLLNILNDTFTLDIIFVSF